MTELEKCAKAFKESAVRIENQQKTHQKEMKDWSEGLDDSLNKFKHETNTEIYGEKGPSGQDGIKSVSHDNKRRLDAIEGASAQTKRDWVQLAIQIAAALSPFVAGLLLFLFLKGGS